MRRFVAMVVADTLAPSIARWSESRERQILATGRALSADFVDFASNLGISDPEQLRIETVSTVPLPVPEGIVRLARRLGLPVFPPAGMCLGRGISALSDDPGLIRHELVHTDQYQRIGSHQAFMHRYLFECVLHGYADAPLEKEARERSQMSL